jgi:8-oxo-dGTP pyrophosphatase MutT (NUDIX family)
MKHLKLFEEMFDNRAGKPFWGDAGAGVLPFYMDKGEPVFLLALRGPEVNEPGTWGVWGGKMERGETPEEAALREFKEECDYDGPIEMHASYVYKTSGFTYHNFLGVLPAKFKLPEDFGWETDEARWVTLDGMSGLDLHFGLEALLEHGMADIQELVKKHGGKR